ncbi:hypothetical protein BKA70DRAFT_1573210 [Coprinopsis sp. MPI-PUGE-AT-0042]|nr:hypothetical protein BKA70DRAFT_1573210 [Coprinopsis sp. MPI-PUGE-AT-0042]
MENTMAKEQALLGPVGVDILPLIFEHLDTSDKRSKANLLNVALSCKAFAGPALDLVWKTLRNLDPLLAFVLPPQESVLLNTEIQKEHRARFDLYRKRVRKFQMIHSLHPASVTAHTDAGRKASLHMCHLLRREELFPNLRELWISGSENNDMDALIPFLLTPSLQSVTLYGRTPPPNQLYPLVTTLAPSITGLQIGDGVDSWSATEGATGAIPLEYLSSLKQLRSLRISPSLQSRWTIKMSSVVQHLLLKLRHLTTLSLAANHIIHDWSPAADKDLQVVAPLNFDLDYNPTASTGLQPFPFLPFVTSLGVSASPFIAVPQEVTSFLSALASNTTLSVFNISGDAAGVDNLLTLDVEDVIPLFSSPTLQRIVLDCLILSHRHASGPHTPPSSASVGPPSSTVVDVILSALKENHASPLKELCLPNDPSPTIPTFTSLMKFAEHGTRLKELSLGVILSPGAVAELQVYSRTQFENSLRKLTIINTGDLPISSDDYPLIAKCIDAWFPSLDEVCFNHGFDEIPRVNELRVELKNSRLPS